ncbi:MAG TPA: cysteine peptidase family C39 domain-containing protein [Candidatus Paceibacterota bacterium]|nr:cysteine peptidase family C39 domain-containing protein [Candidatus Paceibacterota bacterium]
MQIPLIQQENDYYCGPAIIEMILGAYGKKITQNEAAKLAGTTEAVGTSLDGLIDALRKEGFSIDVAENRTIDDLQHALQSDEIVIVNYTEPVWEWGHYAIAEKIDGDTVTLIDPDSRTGRTSMLIEEFERRWKDPLFTKATRWAAFVSKK